MKNTSTAPTLFRSRSYL